MLRRQASSFVVLVLSTASAIVAAFFIPSPWRWIEIGIAIAVDGLALRQISADDRRRGEHDMLLSRTPENQAHMLALEQAEAAWRHALIEAHFIVRPRELSVVCRHCEWVAPDYARRQIDAPQHLRDVHPERDERLPQWLRYRGTAWLVRLGHSLVRL